MDKLTKFGLSYLNENPNWTSLGHSRHLDCIFRELQKFDSSDVGIEGYYIRFSIDIEGKFTQYPAKLIYKNYFNPKRKLACCRLVIRESEAMLSDLDLRHVIVEKLREGSIRFCNFMSQKLGDFEVAKFLSIVETVSDIYMNSDFQSSMTVDETRILNILTHQDGSLSID